MVAIENRVAVPLGLLCLLLTGGCLDDFGADVHRIVDLRRVAGGARPTPAEFDAGATRRLPDLWATADRQVVQSAWYRARWTLEAAPRAPWAVYLPRFAQSAEVLIDGRWIGRSGRVTPPLTRSWNRPLLLPLPRDLLRAGENEIEIHLAVEKTVPAFLSAVYVGPESELAPAYRWRHFLQITCARYGAALLVAISAILGFIALQRREFRPFLFFAGGCLAWAAASSELFIEEPPLPGRWWQVLVMGCIGASVLLFIQSTHRAFERRRPRLEAVLVLILAAIVALLALVPDRRFEAASLVLWAYCATIGVYLGAVFIFSDRPPLPRARALAFLGFAAPLIGLHDLLLGLWIPVPVSVFLAPLLSLLAAFWGAWMVIDHFLGALHESEQLNRELEQRVSSKHAELEENFRRLHRLERQRAISAERERLMREMHDGMGGQLVSALAMAEDGETEPRQIADVLRGALDDMRLVIDSLDPVIDDIPTLLGMMRGRIEPRLRTHGLRFDWRVTDLPPTPHFGPEQFLHVLRIAQEAITNIVKHADAEVIRVETEETAGQAGDAGIRVTIGDDGRGTTGSASTGGRGLSNMRARAEQLRGHLEIESEPGHGTRVRLWIPLDATRTR